MTADCTVYVLDMFFNATGAKDSTIALAFNALSTRIVASTDDVYSVPKTFVISVAVNTWFMHIILPYQYCAFPLRSTSTRM